jgi:hypothetical protein
MGISDNVSKAVGFDCGLFYGAVKISDYIALVVE